MLYNDKPELRALSTTQVVGCNGSKHPAILVSMLWRWCLVCMLKSHSVQKKGHGLHSRQRTTAKLLQNCWKMWVTKFNYANVVLTKHGHSASLLWKESFHVHQFDEARGEAIGVGTSCSLPGHCWVRDLVKTVLLKYHEKFKGTNKDNF